MIKSVTVTNYRNESLTLDLSNPFDIGINVRSIEGIGPPKGNINYTEIASGDGGVYNSARASVRNITMELGPMSTPSVEENRHKIYKYFVLNKEVTLTFETDKRICQIVGYVEECEPDIFSDDETIDVSIVCPNPYFYSIDAGLGTVNFSGVVDEFEFPFENKQTETVEKKFPKTSDGEKPFWIANDCLIQEVTEYDTQALNPEWLIKDKAWSTNDDGFAELIAFPGSYACHQVFHLGSSNLNQLTVNSEGDFSFSYLVFTETGEKNSDMGSVSTPGDLVNMGYPGGTVAYFKYYFINFTNDQNEINNSKIIISLKNISTESLPEYKPYNYKNFGDYFFPEEQTNQNIEFASLLFRQEENIPYDGDVPTGLTIRLHAIGEVRNITIYNMDTRERLVIDTNRIQQITGFTFSSGDDIIISTERGNKSITYIHEGISYNILNAIEKDTDWFILSKGDNVFAYICEYGTEDLQFLIEYPTLYWGI